MIFRLFPQVVNKFWITNRRKTCGLVFLCEVVFILLILFVGFVYVHTFVPFYNAKRLSKNVFVCSPVEDEVLSECEIHPPEEPEVKTTGTRRRKLFYENGNSVEILDANGSAVGERHFHWSSCGEFCTPEGVEASGGCRQLRVKVRAPGSDLRIEGCSNYDVLECGTQFYTGNEFESNEMSDRNGKRTGFLRSGASNGVLVEGIYECIPPPHPLRSPNPPTPICSEASQKWTCPLDFPDPLETCSLPRGTSGDSSLLLCFSQPGLYLCSNTSSCSFTPNPSASPCSRKCDSIPLLDKNVILTNHHGRVITATCSQAFHTHKGFEVWPRGIRNTATGSLHPPLFLNCNIIKTTRRSSSHASPPSPDVIRLDLGDCVNGSLLENSTFPASAMNFESLQSLWFKNLEVEDFHLDPIHQRTAPPETLLDLFSSVPLYLQDFYAKTPCDSSPEESDCSSFYSNYGLGSESSSPQGHLRPIFPCYCRNTRRSTYCIVNGTLLFLQDWEEFLVSRFIAPFAVPIISFVSSVAGLVLIFLLILMWPVFNDKVIAPKKKKRKVATSPAESLGSRKKSPGGDSYRSSQHRRPSYSPSLRSTGGDLSEMNQPKRSPSIFVISSETPVRLLEVEAEVSGFPQQHLQKPRIFETRDGISRY